MKFEDLLLSEKKNYFYIMHLSYGGDKKEQERLWNYATSHNLIGLDQPKIVKTDWTTLSEPEKKATSRTWIRQFNDFCSNMKTGDYVVILNGWTHLLGIARIAEPRHKFDRRLTGKEEKGFFDHIRKVDWKLRYEYSKRLPLLQYVKGFNNTLSKVSPDSSWWNILTKVEL